MNCSSEILGEIAEDGEFRLRGIWILKIKDHGDLYNDEFREKVSTPPYVYTDEYKMVNLWPDDIEMVNLDGDGSILCWYGIDQEILLENFQKVHSLCVKAGYQVKVNNNG